MKVQATQQGLSLSCAREDGDVHVTLGAKVSGPDRAFSINGKYLLDVLERASRLVFQRGGSTLYAVSDDQRLHHVVMLLHDA